jgi:nitroreductase
MLLFTVYLLYSIYSCRGEKNMELKDVISKRRSIRSFLDKPVEKELIMEILQAGILAPTAGNIQPWVFIGITDPQVIKKIRVISPGMLEEPAAVICVYSDQKKAFQRAGKGGEVLALMDCSMAAQNIMLRAYDMGLGTCAIRSFNQSAVREITGAPLHLRPELLIAAGYADENPALPARDTSVIHFEAYGKREEEN